MRAQTWRFGVGLGLFFAVSACHSPDPQTAVKTNGPGPVASDPAPAARTGPSLAMGGTEGSTPEPMVSLTASDGTGLTLVEVDARAVIDDPLALTEIHFTFENPEDRVLEGRFHVTLPKDATLSRLAMRVDGQMQEGEVVEKEVARASYEDALHFKRDPALLEQAAGNEYTARIFPIRAHEKKEVVIAYSQALTSEPYALPLRGLPAVGRLHAEATRVGDSKPSEVLDLASAKPTQDFQVATKDPAVPVALRNADMVVMRVRGSVDAPSEPLGKTIVLVDTSASRALGLRDELRALTELAKRTPEAVLTIACFDQDVEEMWSGAGNALPTVVAENILARGALGASNLEKALSWAATAAKKNGATRVLLLSDGVATAGKTSEADLTSAAKALAAAGVTRLDAIAVGGIRDDSMLHHLVTAGLHSDGVVVDAGRPEDEIVRRLSSATRSHVPVKVAGAKWVYPAHVDGYQSGDDVLVVAEIAPQETLSVTFGDGAALTPKVRSADAPLVTRAVARAKIDSLAEQIARGDKKPETREKMIDLSVKNRIVSQYTSFVVLETEADYQRFGIARRGLSDVMVVDSGRVVLRKHVMPKLPPKALAGGDTPWGRDQGNDPLSATGNMWGDAIGDSFGAGGLGLSGVGEGGGGRGEGIGLGNAPSPAPTTATRGNPQPDARPRSPATEESIGLGNVGTVGHGAGTGTGQGFGSAQGRLSGAHANRVPSVRQGATTVSGRLPPEVIQRIVRQNFGRFRLCYENGLRTDPNLAGRVSVRFVIGADGLVKATTDGGSDLPSPAVVSCVVRGFTNLSFPQPEGGSVTVVYPIIFNPGDGSVPSPSRPQVAQPGAPSDSFQKGDLVDAYSGTMKEVMDSLANGDAKAGLDRAVAWRKESPGDVLALVALGEALEKSRDQKTAARAYGSIIDLFPGRADMRRFAGERLDRLDRGEVPVATQLAIDTYAKAAEDRPDHPSGHRLLAYARARTGDMAGAFAAIEVGLHQKYPDNRFRGVDRILREDAGILASAWIASDPKRAPEIEARVRSLGISVDHGASLRFVLSWETDANDVDFHIFDSDGGHAFYNSPRLPSGGELYADVTTGYGPECFGIRTEKAKRAAPYHLQAHYYSRGPMGYGMGKVEIVEHDGKGHLTFEERPFLVMTDHAFVDLGDYGSKTDK